MKAILTTKTTLALLMSVIIIFQSCSVYKSKPVSLIEASKENIKVKVRTNTNMKMKFKRIEYDGVNFYGIQKENGELIKINLSQNEIKTVKLKNKGLSIFLNILIIATLAVLSPAIVFAAGGGI